MAHHWSLAAAKGGMPFKFLGPSIVNNGLWSVISINFLLYKYIDEISSPQKLMTMLFFPVGYNSSYCTDESVQDAKQLSFHYHQEDYCTNAVG